MRKLLVLLVAGGSLWLVPGAFAAGWCGSGETSTDVPDIVTGPQIHAVVAVPADGADTFATDSGRIADDVAAMSSWWTGQDPTRVPRFDLATFPGGTCLDISLLRLPEPAAAFLDPNPEVDAQALFTDIGVVLGTSSRRSSYKKYLVYYDGPALPADPSGEICGAGGGDFSTGPGFADVMVNDCAGVPIDTVATHELLHALGAVPPGDTNPLLCPGDPGHPCDSRTDILYPYSSAQPLSSLVLDYNHDDYYAHPGTWPDIQDSAWLTHLDVPPFPLTVTFSGAGTVSSDLPGVDCTAACTTQWQQGTAVSLSATATAGSRFIRWSGACTGSVDCQLTLSQPQSLTAVFGPLRIQVRLTTKGKGRVACSPACSKSFPAGDPLHLRAVAAKGWRFTGWGGGACKGKRLTCSPTTDFAVSVRATFRRR